MLSGMLFIFNFQEGGLHFKEVGGINQIIPVLLDKFCSSRASSCKEEAVEWWGDATVVGVGEKV